MASTARTKKAAQPPAQPPAPADAPLAPWPNFDKYPVVIGSSITLQYISSVFRLATTGYRREYVDVLDELLERDPHGYAVLAQRVFGVTAGRIVVEPAKCEESEAEAAEEIRAEFEHDFFAIPDLKQSLASLLWAIFYGVACCEIGWDSDATGWHPTRLFFVHSRRIQYPEPLSWGAHIWDWGAVRSFDQMGRDPTSYQFGVRVADYPGKFILHAPQLRGDYPTRDGLGRELAYWMAIKGMAARSASQYVERFANPWAFGYYATSDKGNDLPRAANTDDIAACDLAVKGLGNGLSGASLPNCIKLEMLGPGMTQGRSGIAHIQLVELCDTQIAKATLGQSDTVDTGSSGSRAAVSVRKEGSLELYRYDADCLGDTLNRDLTAHWTRLNRPGQEHLSPRVRIVFDKTPEVGEIVEYAAKLAAAGAPVDADAIADRCDVALVPREDGDKKPRRMAPLKPVTPFELESGEPFVPPPPPTLPGAPGAPTPAGGKPAPKPDAAKAKPKPDDKES